MKPPITTEPVPAASFPPLTVAPRVRSSVFDAPRPPRTGTPAASDLEYRPDIDGLRGVAVAAVIAYHLEPSLLPGGAAGVDVFFVISGFLITRILQEHQQHGRPLADFYVRRIARIVPALIAVLAVTSLLAWTFLFRDEFDSFLDYLAGSAAFVSNIQLWHSAGYFETSSLTKPLLHLWSLSVEEQFYLLWPPLLALLWRFNRGRIAAAAGAIAALSFAAAVFLGTDHSTADFYLPFTRFWELLAGALIAIRQRSTTGASVLERSRVLPVIGAACVVESFFSIPTVAGNWPGVLTLVPVAGTALLIMSRGGGVAAEVLGSRSLVTIGLISYPLYLWHWPLLTVARLVGIGSTRGLRVAANLELIVIAVLLSLATFRYVERPIRSNPTWVKAGVLLALLISIGVGAVAARVAVLPARLDSAITLEVAAAHRDRPAPLSTPLEAPSESVLPGSSGDTVLMLGDSHMAQYWPRAEALKRSSASTPAVVLWTQVTCTTLPRVEFFAGSVCTRYYHSAFSRASAQGIATIVISANWDHPFRSDRFVLTGTTSPPRLRTAAADSVFASFATDLRRLTDAGKSVFIILSNPAGAALDPARLLPTDRWTGEVEVATDLARTRVAAPYAAVSDELRKVARAVGARVIDPFDYFCTETSCSILEQGRAPMNVDDSHVRASFAARRATFIDSILTTWRR